MSGRLRRWLEAGLGIVVVTAAVVWLSGGCERRVPPGEVDVAGATPPPGARTALVEEVVEPAVEWASGEVASARHTSVSSRVLARIEDVRVRAGSTVAPGDVLVVLDARDLRAAVGEAEEALRSADARLELARQEETRTEELFRTGVAPQRRVDEVRSALRAARADVAGRREALAQARTAASFAEILSPVAGRVVDRLAEPGDTAVPGQPLLRIYDPTLLRVEAPVRESLAVRLRVGDALRVEVPALGEPVEGRIDEIVPFAERGARTLLVKVSLPRTNAHLFAGMFARVAVPAEERRLLLVPSAAVERVGQLEFVELIDPEGRIERRLVTTGRSDRPGSVEVLSGVRAGDRLLLLEAGAAAPEAGGQAGGDATARAAAAVAAARDALGAALRSALAEGPEQAIRVCRVEAPRITAAASSGGVTVGRTSHRLRNPANAPEEWMLPLLEAYRQADTAAAPFRTVDLGPRGTGYVEPIRLQPPCATCHGESVEPGLLARIRELYPDDQAVGFRVGELRGLFWAVVAPPQS